MKRPRVWLLLAVILFGMPASRPVSEAPESETAIRSTESSAPLEAIRALIQAGQFTAAEDRCRALRAEVIAGKGEGSLSEAHVLDLLVEALWRGGRGAEPAVLELALKAVSIKEQRLGLEDPDVATSLRLLGALRGVHGQAPEAIALYERAIGIFQRKLGEGDPEVADTQVYLGNLHLGERQYSAARALFANALAIREKTGPEKRVASILHNLGLLNHYLGEFRASREFYGQALTLKTKLLGPDDLDVAWTLNAMANLAEETGEFAEAKSLFERTLAIRRKKLGGRHIHVAGSMNNLGNHLSRMGEYADAARYLEEALAIQNELLGEDSANAAMTQLNLAQVSRRSGDFKRAFEFYRSSLRIREKILKADDPVIADTLGELAMLHAERGEFPESEVHFRRALAILGSNPVAAPAASMIGRERAGALNGLGGVLLRGGLLVEARRLFEQALEIRRKTFRPDHPMVAESLEGLAGVHRRSGDFEAAEAASREVLGIRLGALGLSHPLTALAYRDLGLILACRGDTVRALESALNAERIGREHLRLTSRSLPDRQALLYASVRTSGLDLALGLAAGDLDPAARGRVWETLIQSRAAVLDEMASRRRSLAVPSGNGAADREIDALLARLAAASRRLSNLHVRGPNADDADPHYRLLDEALKEKESLERALAAKSARFRDTHDAARFSLDRLLRQLPAGAALIAYARYDDPRSDPAVPHYLAFVARAGERIAEVVPLGRGDDVDRLIERWSASVMGESVTNDLSGELLRRMIWDPVAAGVRGASRVFVVPDGKLNLVSLAALPVSATSYLVETGPIVHYLSAERELLAGASATNPGRGLLAMGGPAFDLSSQERSSQRKTFRGGHASCGYFKDVIFPPLPGALQEVDEIAAVWEGSERAGGSARPGAATALRLTAGAAGEEALKAHAPGRRVVHLATHGFYLDGHCSSAIATSRGIGGIGAARPDTGPPAEGENPLVLSGLALAGANRRQSAARDQEDGILTAEEIAALDLSGVDWVVLSACLSGVGEVRTGEGVLGLRRAFQIAGARTMVMSLWPVEDEATRQWMVALYKGRFEDGLDTAEAVHQASLKILKSLRGSRASTSPRHWAAFVASGDWR